MKVCITGSTGFVGKGILSQLLAAGHEPRCLVRQTSAGKLAGSGPVSGKMEVVEADVTRSETLTGKMDGCEAVIHLVGIIREIPRLGISFERLHYEASKNVIDEARRAGVKRFLHMSALGSRAGAVSKYHQTKYRAEQYLIQSGLNYTIFRPSLIFGPEDKSINLFAKMIKSAPIVPVIGDGKNLFQPVALENVAQGFVNALTCAQAENKIYEVAGPERMSNDELLDTIAGGLRRKIIKLHQPVALVRPMVRLMERFSFFPLISYLCCRRITQAMPSRSLPTCKLSLSALRMALPAI